MFVNFVIVGEECKRTGEEFKPLGHRQKLRKDEMEEDSDNERPDKEDDLTDLYPSMSSYAIKT